MERFCAGSLFVVCVGIALMLGTGCEFQGGGQIPSVNGVDRASFGANGVLDIEQEIVRGQAQYNDRGVDVTFHAELGNLDGCVGGALTSAQDFLAANLAPSQIEGFAFSFGTYRPQPRNLGESGCLVMFVLDGGEPGAGEDLLALALFGGFYDGYVNIGLITNGNIQAKLLE